MNNEELDEYIDLSTMDQFNILEEVDWSFSKITNEITQFALSFDN